MRPLSARGVTLLELLLAVVMLGILGAVVSVAARAAARGATRAIRSLGGERDATAMTMLLGHDLRAALVIDVQVPAPDRLEFDRPIGEAPVCGTGGGGILLRSAGWLGLRAPAAARDEVLLLVLADPAQWQRLVIAGTAGDTCPDGAPAIRLTTSPAPSPGLHARVVEPVRLRRYSGSGVAWLGLEHRWNGTAIQPFAGPVDSAGAGWSLVAGELLAHYRGGPRVAASIAIPLE